MKNEGSDEERKRKMICNKERERKKNETNKEINVSNVKQGRIW